MQAGGVDVRSMRLGKGHKNERIFASAFLSALRASQIARVAELLGGRRAAL